MGFDESGVLPSFDPDEFWYWVLVGCHRHRRHTKQATEERLKGALAAAKRDLNNAEMDEQHRRCVAHYRKHGIAISRSAAARSFEQGKHGSMGAANKAPTHKGVAKKVMEVTKDDKAICDSPPPLPAF